MSNNIGESNVGGEVQQDSPSFLSQKQQEWVQLLVNGTEEFHGQNIETIRTLFKENREWFDTNKDDPNTDHPSFIEDINTRLEELFGIFFHEDFHLEFDYSALSVEIEKGLQDQHERDTSVIFVHLLSGAIERFGAKNAKKYMKETLKPSGTQLCGKIQVGTSTFAHFRFKDHPDNGTSLYSYLLADEYIRLLIDFFHYIHKEKLEALIQGLLIDPLTGLPNRISTYMRSNRYIKGVGKLLVLCNMSKIPFSVLVLDADDFKRINTNFGHEGGDQVLREFGIRIKKFIESKQFNPTIAKEILESYHLPPFAGRLGGEEFVIMLPGFDEEKSLEFAKGLSNALSGTPIQIGDMEKTITATIGVSTLDITQELLQNPPEDPKRKGDTSISGYRALGRLPASAHSILSLLFKQADSPIETLKSRVGKGRIGHYNSTPKQSYKSLQKKMLDRIFSKLNDEVRGGTQSEKLVGIGRDSGFLGEFSQLIHTPHRIPVKTRARVDHLIHSNKGRKK